MALATRPKPTVHHKKRQAQHHRHSKHYLKAYWPYIPVLVIVGAGAVVNRLWTVGGPGLKAAAAINPQLSSGQSAARIQVLAGSQASWMVAAVSFIAGVALGLFILRDWYRLHRLINRGEAFIYKHRWFDLAMVLVFTAGFILASAAGGR
jgi:uncharacterized membrane protein YidH (DUF202 family)